MKPIYLELQAFGPFVEKQTVDFEKLSSSGIFLIKGKTGSGKTTIFDAMTVALYGGGSGENETSRTGRNDFAEWRCAQAPDELPTYVSFEFEVKGRRYRFARRITKKRINDSLQYEAGFYNDEGVLVPFFNNPKKNDLNSKAVELIGLTKEQFRQVVLLPQGQFERFLTAPSGDKEAILQKVFNTARWDKYTRIMFDRACARKKGLDDEKAHISKSLAEEEKETLSELEEYIGSLRTHKAEILSAHVAFDGKKKQAELDADRELFEQFKPLHNLESKLAALNAKAEEIAAKRDAYEQAEKAEKLRSVIEEYENKKRDYSFRQDEQRKLNDSVPGRKEAVAAAEEKKSKHDTSNPVPALQKKIGEYSSKRDAYRLFEPLSEEFRLASEEYAEAEEKLQQAEKSVCRQNENCSLLLKKASAEADNASALRTKYFSGIYGEIAGSLSEGEKCPVCGSIHHPEPAEKTEDSVSREQLEAQEAVSDAAMKGWKNAESARNEAEKARDELKRAADNKNSEMQKAESALESAKQTLIDGISDLDSLDAAIEGFQAKIDAYENEDRTLAESLSAAQSSLNSLITQLSTAESEVTASHLAMTEAESSLNTAILENGYRDCACVKALLLSGEERTNMHTELVAYDTSVEETKKDIDNKRSELAGKTEPDSSRFKMRKDEIDDENKSFAAEEARTSELIGRLEKKLNNLSELDRHFSENIHQAESDLVFARRLRGDSGIGLQRYILAVMFNTVIEEANRMLKNVHNGRYSLFRSDEKGDGNKRGLELRVHDNRSPDDESGRPVSMLSGGEKFLVSLSLSIGLSTVAQKSGVQIDALFIDEGFGTLDENSIADAMNILESVRKGSSTIGIISHVQLLESVIPSKLEVEKTDSGNYIKQV